MALLNKYDFGKSLMPKKILKIELKKTIEKNYRILYYDNFYYGTITNIYGISIILAFITYLYFFQYFYLYFSDYYGSFGWSIILNTTFLALLTYLYFYGIILLLYFKYEIKIKKREKKIEEGLPYFLDNLVSNLKGGIPIEKSLIDAVPKDNKIMLEEIILMNERIMMGEDFLVIIEDFIHKYNSPLIRRTFFLLSEGLKGGGNLADSIETISKNIKNINNLFNEFVANTSGFAFIIMLISVALSPFLFAVALVLLVFLSNLFTLFTKNTANSGHAILNLRPVPPKFISYLKNFSYVVIITINFFSSLIVAELKNEKLFNAIKYVPFFIIISILVYMGASDILLKFFENII